MSWTSSGSAARRVRVVGWLAALAFLVHGWLPVFVQVSNLGSTAGGHDYAQHALATDEARDTAQSGKNRECPLTHDVICLCVAFAKVLPSAGAPEAFAARAARGSRGRFRSGRLPRPAPALLFDARAPPDSD